MEIRIEPKKAAAALAVIAVSLILASIAGQLMVHYFGLTKLVKHFDLLFNVDYESNIPAFFSALLLISSAALLSLIAFAKKKQRYFLHWLGLAVIFLFLSIDEIAQVHESIINVMRELFNASGYFRDAWVIPYGIFAFLLLVVYSKFLYHLPARTRLLFLTAGFCYVASAIGLEMLDAKYDTPKGVIDAIDVALFTVEELLEMTGIIVFIYALLLYMQSELRHFRISLESGEAVLPMKVQPRFVTPEPNRRK